MFLKDIDSGDLVRVCQTEDLFNPAKFEVLGQIQAGEEEQEATWFQKSQLVFPSGEPLPRCWQDVNYRIEAAGEETRAAPKVPR
jgi:hypothetical protein